jgi:hypothetical protein
MDKESKYLLQKIDCDCNDCGYLERDLTKIPKGTSFPILEGFCNFLNKRVKFIPNICQLETQECFKHRLDSLTEEERNKKLGKLSINLDNAHKLNLINKYIEAGEEIPTELSKNFVNCPITEDPYKDLT